SGSYRASEVHGMSSGELVGTVFDYTPPNTSGEHAALWHGSAESFIALQPASATQSAALATDGAHQYGWADFPTQRSAAMRSGSAESGVTLDPGSVAGGSEVLSAARGWEAGNITPAGAGGITHAAVWAGTAASFRDINPPGSVWSDALGVCESAAVGWVSSG